MLGTEIVLACSLGLTDQMLSSPTLGIVYTDVVFPRNQFVNEKCELPGYFSVALETVLSNLIIFNVNLT